MTPTISIGEQNMSVVKTIKLIRVIFPDMRGSDLQEAIQKFDAIVNKNKEANMSKDYQQGYNVGAWLNAQGEELGPKEIDETANELLEDLEWTELPVNNAEEFKAGMYNGYTINSDLEEDEDE